jgi:hypothetical protein
MHGGWGPTYACYHALAEAGAAVEPVIVLELVDFDALPFAGRRRSYVCHNRRRRADTLRLGRAPSGAKRAIAMACAVRCGQLAERLAMSGVGVGVGDRDVACVVLADDEMPGGACGRSQAERHATSDVQMGPRCARQ